MIKFFDDFTEEELKGFKDLFVGNFDYDKFEGCVKLTQPEAEDAFNEEIKFFKKGEEIYVECEEEEGMYEKRDNAIYYLDPVWYYKVDMSRLLGDYVAGEEIDPNEYRI